MRWRFTTGCALLALSGAAWAGETPLYQPAPAWITPAPPVAAGQDGDAPALLLFDSQRRLEKGRLWSYVDTATRIASAEMLGQAGTVSIPWSPDQGDLIVHRVEIVRGSERIDLVKGGQRFSVLRREEGLERRELTGLLTATLPVQGLAVGDVLRIAFSVTAADPALKGKAQALMPVMAAPLRAGFARARLQWPVGAEVNWKLHGEGAAPVSRSAGGWSEVTVAMPLPKQPETPPDAPARFRLAPMLALSGFADWADVSRTMAPLFAADGLIRPGDALDREVKGIMAATPDPLVRAQRALELAQDKVRYLLMGMAGGNYTPQTPARTWETRYGDCKAKTLLLLAMLRAMNIDAEPVLAASAGGDALPGRLPMPGAFDHVLVRATVGGDVLWLDGTRSGSRLADIRDTPAFHHVLPLRPAGAGLMPVPMRAPARPEFEASLEVDESAAVDLPTLFKATLVFRGPAASQIATISAQAAAEQKREMVDRMMEGLLRDALLSEYALRYDPAAAAATVTASGLASTGWSRQDRRFRRDLGGAVSSIEFAPNRARPAWTAIPVATAAPGATLVRTRLKLPGGGQGFAIEGERDLSQMLGGRAVRRATRLADGVVAIEERVETSGVEIAPGDIPAERAKFTRAKALAPRIVAPADVTQYWEAAAKPGGAAKLALIEAAFAKAVAADPDDASSLNWRATFRTGVGDRRGAIEDLDRAIAIEPAVERFLQRARIRRDLGQDKAALADIEEALKLDPSSSAAAIAAAQTRFALGDGEGALALLRERADLGGEERFTYLRARAELQSDMGDVKGALATMDAAIEEKPGDHDLLNMRCWIKGTRAVALDTALKDCTRSIELSDNPGPALDSRALVYLRLKRTEEALANVQAALDAMPEQAGSLYLRGVIRKRMGDGGRADADLAAARALSPRIDKIYARYDVAP